MKATNYNYYLREPFEKAPDVIAKYKKAGKKPVMVANKKTKHKEAKYYIPGEATIQLSVRYGKKLVMLNTGQRIRPILWDFNTKAPKIGKAPGLADDLAGFRQKVKDLFKEKVKDNEHPTAQEIKTAVAIKKDTAFFELYQEFLDLYDTDKNILKSSRGIVRSFEQTRDKIKKKFPGYEFNDIDLRFYDKFTTHLKKQGLNLNTIGRHIKNLKMFMKWSYKRKYHKNQDYIDFKIKSEPVIKFFFNPGELSAIINHKFTEGSRLDRVRDMFIISCFTGLRYVDYIGLKPGHIKTGELKKDSAKSGAKLSVSILPEARAIFDKWLRLTDGENIIPYPMKGNRPGISNVKMNDYLKEMARAIDEIKDVRLSIKKGNNEIWFKKASYIASHVGRRSFCSNMHYIGMASKKIMEASGHRTMSSFEKYVLTDDQNYFEQINGMLEQYVNFKNKLKLRVV